jgi:predicted ATP-grasp superfamily ATP-dependent carboligase
MSTAPSAAEDSAISACAPPGSERSATTATARPPASSISSTTGAARCRATDAGRGPGHDGHAAVQALDVVVAVHRAEQGRTRDTMTGMPQRAFAGRLDGAVLDADERQSLVSVRSLGRSGLCVGAFDSMRFSPASTSKWCSMSERLPDAADEQRYVDAVLDVVRRRRPRVLFVARDSTIEALRPWRAEFERGSSLALAPERALEVAVSKERTLALAKRLGIPVPISVPIEDSDAAFESGSATGFPAVVKPVQSWVQSPAGGRRLRSVIALDADEARRATEDAMRAGGRVLLQHWLHGSREAVSLVCVDGKVRARFAQVARRMVPPLGGSSIVRESIPLPPDLTDAAEAIVVAAGLDGYSEVEFRRDIDGTGFLMEINPRLSASVEVAVRAGVDFPALLYAWASGRPLPSVPRYREGVRMRWLGGDIRWLRQTLDQRGRPEVLSPRRAVREFASDCLVPYAYDYVTWSDLRPAVTATTRALAKGARRRHRAHRAEATA